MPSLTSLQRSARRNPCLLALASLLGFASGCMPPGYLHSRDRYKNGIVFVLPGIEGPSYWNRNLALGLDEGGVRAAIEVYDWTIGVPGAMVLNIANYGRNRDQAAQLAKRIVQQRDRYPGTPVYLIGHSGGAGVAVFALEALPAGRQIDEAILLAPALSPDYDLTTALRRTKHGVLNLYSELDFGLLGLGTTALGTADRAHTPSAGLIGFKLPDGLTPAAKTLYASKLRQVEWNRRLRQYGASGTHMGWTSREFAREYLSPIILQNTARDMANHPTEAAEAEAQSNLPEPRMNTPEPRANVPESRSNPPEPPRTNVPAPRPAAADRPPPPQRRPSTGG